MPKGGADSKAVNWSRALRAGAHIDKETFPEFPTVLYWLRQILGIIIGIVFAAVSSAIVFGYYSRYVDVDEDDFGRYELLSEGFMPSFGLFLTFWITLYTALHT